VAFRDLDLNPDVEPWDQQPHESNTAYQRFRAYLDQPPSERSARKVAERFQKSVQVTNRQRRAHLWDYRAAAFDADFARRHHLAIEEKAVKLANGQIDVARAMLSVVASSVGAVGKGEDPKLKPTDVPRWVSASVQLGKAAREVPDLILKVLEDGQDEALEFDVPELNGLTLEEARERVGEMVSTVSRLADYRDRDRETA
jgi:hypothetical protein